MGRGFGALKGLTPPGRNSQLIFSTAGKVHKRYDVSMEGICR